MTPLERAARAADEELQDAFHENRDPDQFKIARAVLMAVREPDEAMKTAWLNAETHGTESAWFLHRHRAMIDAILADGGE